MTALLTEHLPLVASAPNGVKKIRDLILELAVMGKLVPQDPSDEPASELLRKIQRAKSQLRAKPAGDRKIAATDSQALDRNESLPSGWIWTCLDEVAFINPRNIADDDAVVSFVPMSLVSKGFDGRHGQEQRLWRDVKSGFTHFANGDVGIAKITPCFENSKACIFDGLKSGIGAGTTELHIVRPIDGFLDCRYILAFLKSPSFLSRGEMKMTGTAGQKRLPKDFLAFEAFPLAPLAEQRRIVAKVDELMALCDRLDAEQSDAEEAHSQLVSALLDTLTQSIDQTDFATSWQRIKQNFDTIFSTDSSIDALKQTLMQLAVMGKLVPQDQRDEPASELLKMAYKSSSDCNSDNNLGYLPVSKDDYLFPLPEQWQFCKFGQIAKIKSELVSPDLFEDFEQVAPDSIEKYSGKLIERRTVKEAGVKSSNHHFYPGQILYSKIRPSLSKAVLVDFEGLCSADMYPLETILLDKFLLLQILSPPFLKQALLAENRVKMPKLNKESLYSFVLSVPPLAEQHRIVAKVDTIMMLCDGLKNFLLKARSKQELISTVLQEQAVSRGMAIGVDRATALLV